MIDSASPTLPRSTLRFFLGGHDLEMVAIRELLEQHAPGQYFDDNLAWGARLSNYEQQIERELGAGRTVVLIELIDDIGLLTGPHAATVINVDHHGELAGHDQPTALEQVFQLLELPNAEWTRWYELVAANDRGHVPAMLQCGASQAELQQVRAADRAAQGITSDEESIGREASQQAETQLDGRLTVVHLPHSRTATVTDSLDRHLGGPGFENLVVYCPDSVMFYGDGRIIDVLRSTHADGYFGGDLPERGFWGISRALSPPELQAVIARALTPSE